MFELHYGRSPFLELEMPFQDLSKKGLNFWIESYITTLFRLLIFKSMTGIIFFYEFKCKFSEVSECFAKQSLVQGEDIC